MSRLRRGLRSTLPRAAVVAAVSLAGASTRAESVRFYDLEGFGHFLDGNPETTAVTEDGAVALPPPTRERFSDAAAVFSAATARNGDVVVARVEDGQVVAIDPGGRAKNLFKAEETMVASLFQSGDDLFVGTGAPGKIYRITKDGKSELWYTADAGYIWSIVRGPDGALFASTGEPGTVVRIDKKGSGKVVFAPDQAHLRALTYDPRLGLVVGGGERGVVYRAATGTDFRALYDTGNPEVTAIALRGGYVFAAGVTGAQELAEGGGSGAKDKKSGVRSTLVRIGLDGAAETLAGSSDEAVFALALDERGQVLVATGATGRDDPRGRIYSVDPDKRLISMLYQSPSRRITHLVSLGGGALGAVSAAGGRITELTPGFAKTGEFYTVPFDAGINARFGIVQLFGDWPKGTKVTGSVRSGQTADPDQSWSEWSPEVAAPGNLRPKVPNGRYVQVRVTLAGDGKLSPSVYRLRLAYLRQNLAPFVREVTALSKGLALYALPQETPKSKTVSLNEKPSPEDQRRHDEDNDSPPPPTRARQVEESGALTLRWVAEDPNGDELRYDLEYRQSGRGNWRALKSNLQEPFYTLRSSQLPDGHYQFRVQATDAPSNALGEERTDSRESRDVVIDNSPPRIDPLKVQVEGKRVTVRGSFADVVGPLVSATYSLDAREPKPVMPDDGVLDGPSESFALRLGELPPGSHTLTVRVRDEAQNEGVAEATFTTP